MTEKKISVLKTLSHTSGLARIRGEVLVQGYLVDARGSFVAVLPSLPRQCRLSLTHRMMGSKQLEHKEMVIKVLAVLSTSTGISSI